MPHSPDGFKVCTKCDERKPLDCFFKNKQSKSDGVMSRCKVCKGNATKEWIAANPERRKEKHAASKRTQHAKERAKSNSQRPEVKARNAELARIRRQTWTNERKSEVAKYQAEYRKSKRPHLARNTEKHKAYRYEYARRESSKVRAREYARTKNSTPRGNIDNRMSSSIWRAVQKDNRSWVSLVGYTLDQLMTHLERQFSKGMGWHNFGDWHIDHIVPKSSFTYTSAEDPEFLECWSLSNLRPLWAEKNLSKGSKQIFLL